MTLTNPCISVIIPTLNEAKGIGALLDRLRELGSPKTLREIIVVDGKSSDATVQRARDAGARVIHSPRGRAIQMNRGAAAASGTILYFLHADTLPPAGFDRSILAAVEKGYEAGCFRMQFDSDSGFLKFFSWFTRINHPFCRGGDQSLFVTAGRFKRSGGFDESYRIYEDNEYTARLYRNTRFAVLPEQVTTSARRYRKKNMVGLQFHYAIMHLLKGLGAGPQTLHRYYSRYIAIKRGNS